MAKEKKLYTFKKTMYENTYVVEMWANVNGKVKKVSLQAPRKVGEKVKELEQRLVAELIQNYGQPVEMK